MDVADHVTVFRDGELVDSMPIGETSMAEIAEMMIGRKMGAPFEKSVPVVKEDVPYAVELKDFAVDMPGEQSKGVSLQVKRGEIFGLAGLAGQGKLSIANGIMGLYPSTGKLFINGEEIHHITPQKILERKCAFVSEDRKGTGLLLDNSIEANIAIAAIKVQKKYIHKFGPFSQVDKRKARKHALEMIEALDIRCTGPAQYTRRLSGGNQQKVCVARALSLDPDILLVSEPTRGIDIGAKRLLMEYLVKLNQERGMTIIITSSELAELRSVCDRIAIIYDGRVEGILPATASDHEYGLYMMGLESGGKGRSEAEHE